MATRKVQATKRKAAVKKSTAVKKKVTRRKPPLPRPLPKTKSYITRSKVDGFAIGVTPEHYWLITSMAVSKASNRMDVLRGILNLHMEQAFKKVRVRR
jgi:hypothetical protein